MNRMKKGILVMGLLLLVLTGCSSQYEIIFDGNVFKESIKSEFNVKELDEAERLEFNDFNVYGLKAFDGGSSIMHNGGVSFKGNKGIVDFSYDYDNRGMEKAYLLNSCFDSYVFLDEDDYYYLHVIGKFGCMYGDKINVSIVTDNMVTETNAKINNNRYTWVINRDNMDDVDMFIKISKTEKKASGNVISSFKLIGFIILGILSAVAIGMAVFISKGNGSSYSEY